MNIVRLIKLKQLNGDLDNLSDVEKDFISVISQLKPLSDFPCEKMFYIDYINRCALVHDTKFKSMSLGADHFWTPFTTKYNIKIGDLKQAFEKILKTVTGEDIIASGYQIMGRK